MRGVRPRRSRFWVVPVSFQQAGAYVNGFHRHHARPQGHKFSLGLVDQDGRRVGVAIIGRPVARHFDDGWGLEVTRLATDGSPNACSALYAAAWRAARAQGYRRLITYTQDGESGASLRAAGFRKIAVRAARPGWNTPSRPRQSKNIQIARSLWEITAADAPGSSAWRDKTRGETGDPISATPARHGGCCAVCRAAIGTAATGRPRRYCSPSCRQAAYRDRLRSRS